MSKQGQSPNLTAWHLHAWDVWTRIAMSLSVVGAILLNCRGFLISPPSRWLSLRRQDSPSETSSPCRSASSCLLPYGPSNPLCRSTASVILPLLLAKSVHVVSPPSSMSASRMFLHVATSLQLASKTLRNIFSMWSMPPRTFTSSSGSKITQPVTTLGYSVKR